MPTDRTPAVVVGGSIAGLVAANVLAGWGVPVRLLVPGLDRVAGGFLNLRVDGRSLALGVRLLELDYDGALAAARAAGAPAPSLDAYEPGPAGHVPYLPLVHDTVEDLAGGRLTEVGPPQLALRGVRGPDVHLTADLRNLACFLTAEELASVAAEADAAEAALGPAGLLAPGAADLFSLAYDEASLRNNGPTFHRLLVAPLVEKVVPGGAAAVAAALRRKAWMTLFHPRTLAEAAGGGPVSFRPHRPFHADASGGMDAVVRELIGRVASHPLVAVEEAGPLVGLEPPAAGRPGRLRFAEGVEVEADRPIVGVPANEVFAAAGVDHREERILLGLAWVEVDEADVVDDPATVLLADPSIDAYRVSHGGRGRPGTSLYVVELRHGVAGDAELAHAAARKAVVAAGVVDDPARAAVVHHLEAPGLPSPSTTAVAAFRAARAELAERAPWLHVVGGAAAKGADSLNEQIVQGLYAAHVLAA